MSNFFDSSAELCLSLEHSLCISPSLTQSPSISHSLHTFPISVSQISRPSSASSPRVCCLHSGRAIKLSTNPGLHLHARLPSPPTALQSLPLPLPSPPWGPRLIFFFLHLGFPSTIKDYKPRLPVLFLVLLIFIQEQQQRFIPSLT